MIMLHADFDYNKRTFVPTNPPYLMGMDSFLQERQMSKRQAIGSTPGGNLDLVYVTVDHGMAFHTTALSLSDLTKKGSKILRDPLKMDGTWIPWESVENHFPSATVLLKSSVFDSWEPMRQENIRKQLLVMEESPHYRPFISNALRLAAEKPRHKTHLIKVQAKLGLGLGQISALTDYQVLTPDEVKEDLKEKYKSSSEALDDCLKGCVDVENHPSILANGKVDPNTVRLSILFETAAGMPAVMSSFWSFPERYTTTTGHDDNDDAVASQHAKCDAKAHELFDELKKIQFPSVTSPKLH